MALHGRRALAAAAAALLALGAVTACTPTPEPTPTATASGFASEAEAFAAAEATYRAYVEAVNEVNLAEPATFEPVYQELTGAALGAAKQRLTEMHADGWVVGGRSVVTVVEPREDSATSGSVMLAICVDVSAVTLTDSAGVSQVHDRPDIQSLKATVVPDSGRWRISVFDGREGAPECGS